MLSLPMIVEREETPYAALALDVTVPFDAAVGQGLGEVGGWLKQAGHNYGPAVFRFTRIDMPRLGIEFGFLTSRVLSGAPQRLKASTLPAGRYATLTHWGQYEQLEATIVLVGWAKEKGLIWDVSTSTDGDHFASRFELYPNSPADEPDPNKWEAQIFIKLRD